MHTFGQRKRWKATARIKIYLRANRYMFRQYRVQSSSAEHRPYSCNTIWHNSMDDGSGYSNISYGLHQPFDCFAVYCCILLYTAVYSFVALYYGATENSFEEEIKSRLRSGNACYHSVQSRLSFRLLSKNLKIKIYRTIILPVADSKGGKEVEGV